MNFSRFLLAARLRTLLVFATRTPRAGRSRARSGQWIALAAILLVTFGVAPSSAAQTNLIHVTTPLPGNSSGGCSLQEAIYSANFDQAIAIDTVDPDHFYNTGCEPGSGTDTIVLTAGSVFQMTTIVDDAHNPFGPTATPIIFTNIIIEANGSRLELVPGSPNMRAFAVGIASVDLNPGGAPNVISGTGNLTIRNAHIKGFTVKGGNGAAGGGGGMGAGGAIYVNGGGLTVENSTFELNGATGGNGTGGGNSNAGGGGGGLGGNGGSHNSNNSGGGGGGSRGNGGVGGNRGGGGGGTVTNGFSPDTARGLTDGGFDCGGFGATEGLILSDANGHDGSCPGGGGGGGAVNAGGIAGEAGSGGKGNYGGGGGGGAFDSGSGGNGGFGGGGGGGGVTSGLPSGSGGNGDFGGGGGAGDHNGVGGVFAGDADKGNGGGGAALGGAIFNNAGTVTIQNSTFTGNFVNHGLAGGGAADNGADAGGAIFSRNGSLTVQNATVSGNQGTGSGAGIVVINDGSSASFTLDNTIIAGNGSQECFFKGAVTYAGIGNLIVNDFGCTGLTVTPSPDPQLGPLQINAPGNTPTMAILPTSPAVDVADAGTSLPTDQRGVARPIGAGFDVGAFEARAPAADLSIAKSVSSSTALVGDTITYTLTPTNNGPDDASNVTVTDNLPGSLTFVSCSSTGGGVCGGSGNNVKVTYPSMAANGSASITLQATLNSGVADASVVTNTASVGGASPNDPDSSNNTASVPFTVQNKSDLFVTKKANLTSVKAASNLVYTVTVKNQGPFRAAAVVMTDPVPSNSTFVSLNAGASCTAPAVGTVGTISCNFGNMANGASSIVTITVKVNGSGNKTSITNTATASAASFDPNPANNSASVTTQIYRNKK